MITWKRRTMTLGLDFEKYLAIDRLSNSSLKSIQKEFKMTEKIQFGKEVDEILTNPEYISQNNEARRVAATLTNTFGDLINHCHAQVSAFATAVHEESGLQLPLKTRPDFVLMGSGGKSPRITIDLKVSAERVVNFRNVLEFMGWDKQCYLHRKLCNAPTSYLLIYSRPDKTAKLLKQTEDFDYWMEEVIFDYGKMPKGLFI